MFNLATFVVVPKNICRDIGERDNFGRMALDKFVTTRMLEKKKKNFCDFKKQKNRSYFKHVGATVKTKVSGQIVTSKQEIMCYLAFLLQPMVALILSLNRPSVILNSMWSHLIFTQMD